MTEFVKTNLSDDFEVLVAVEPATSASASPSDAPPSDVSSHMAYGVAQGQARGDDGAVLTPKRVARLEDAIKVANLLAKTVETDLLTKPESQLSEVNLELSLGFSAEGKVLMLAKASGSAALRLELKWTRRSPLEPTED